MKFSNLSVISLKILLALATVTSAGAVSNAQTVVSVKDTVMRTYPFADPDPVPQMGEVYPYWRFQHFTKEGEECRWTLVVLENDYLRVKIFPEIGGKVWSVFDKSAGKEMFYDNDVVKFRDISLRGPWTSGGIEFNYGVIGHAPSCASPVDWKVENKPDGSASCYIGVFEMLSRSHWTIEINLPKDAVWLRTTSTWHNDSGEYQPYYSWANSGMKTSDDLMLVYPSDNAVSHWGEKMLYPLDEQNRDLSLYSNQAFGPDKSYHMVGSHKSFFGSYYKDDDWGVMHWALRDEKLGRKYYTWALSDQGGIWIDLLTDTRPQYIEMQSGKLYNQNFEKSSRISSYRQILFTPYGTDRWSDFWLPYSGIGPADNVTLDAVTSVVKDGKKVKVGIYPLHSEKGMLVVSDEGGRTLHKQECTLEPARTLSFEFKTKEEPAVLSIAGKVLWRADEEIVDRPQDRNPQFNADSPSGQMLMARDYVGLRKFNRAEVLVDSVLAAEPSRIDALTLKADLLYRRMCYGEAYDFSGKALAVDQYDADAGYIGGLAAVELGKYNDAFDRFEVAAISNGALRTAAYTELARLHFKRGNIMFAKEYAEKALMYNCNNFTALQILYKAGGCPLESLESVNPLSHFCAAERMLSGTVDAGAFADSFQEELPWEDYLELAVFYNSLGLTNDAVAILEALPSKNSLTALWTAYLEGDTKAVSSAEKCDVKFVFPFRRESCKPLEWAVNNGGKWQSHYLLAMLKDFYGYKSEASALMQGLDSDYAPYYAYRYKFSKDAADLEKAIGIDPDEWRYCKMLSDDLMACGKHSDAVSHLEKFYASHPDNVQIGDALIDAYLAADMFPEAERILDTIEYLPFEGLKGSHDKYRHTKLHLAAEAIDKGDLTNAERLLEEALLWPVRLGVGKPYDDMIDTSVEDWMRREIDARKAGDTSREKVLPRLGNLLSKDSRLF
ncbi:MAG: DUF5107 domain-containing protein [Bacteroidales bacterium]|nr:DUF5107 domain-containing protein [Candidatus Cacconaster merdequi]